MENSAQHKMTMLQSLKWYIENNPEAIPHSIDWYIDRFEAHNMLLKYLLSTDDSVLLSFLEEGGISLTAESLNAIHQSFLAMQP